MRQLPQWSPLPMLPSHRANRLSGPHMRPRLLPQTGVAYRPQPTDLSPSGSLHFARCRLKRELFPGDVNLTATPESSNSCAGVYVVSLADVYTRGRTDYMGRAVFTYHYRLRPLFLVEGSVACRSCCIVSFSGLELFRAVLCRAVPSRPFLRHFNASTS